MHEGKGGGSEKYVCMSFQSGVAFLTVALFRVCSSAILSLLLPPATCLVYLPAGGHRIIAAILSSSPGHGHGNSFACRLSTFYEYSRTNERRTGHN